MQNINVNIVPDNFPQTIRYSQGDIGRQFKINVADFDIPVGATVKIQATKPSGFGFSVAGVVSDNSVTFTTTEEMTDEAGRFQAELQITAGGDVIGTANFLMIGERNPHPEGTTDGSQGTIIPELTLLVERVEKAASDVLDMEVVATTLPAGSQATYSYDEALNKATFGIPEGQAGAGAAGVVASAYSAAKTYKVGDYVLYNSNLYRCTMAITTAEAWTAAHWTQVVLADDVTDLKTDLDEYADIFTGNVDESVKNWLDEHPEATTTVEDGSLTEPKFSNALKLKSIKDYLSPMMYGAVGDGVADDTSALNSCVADCVSTGLPLFIPKGKTLLIPQNQLIQGLKTICVEGTIKAPNGIEFRFTSNQTGCDWSFNNINGALVLSGLKNAIVKIVNATSLTLWADSAVSNAGSIAYNQFILGYVPSITIKGVNSGWINENFFYGGRVGALTVEGSYPHNNNYFINNSFESATIDFKIGHSNHIINARLEGNNSITFRENTSTNVVHCGYMDIVMPNVQLNSPSYWHDLSGKNFFYTGIQSPIKVYEKRFTVDSFNYDCEKLYPLNGKLHNRDYNNKFVLTNKINISHGLGVRFISDKSFFRGNIYIYDDNGDQITTEPAQNPFNGITIPWDNSSSSYSYYSANHNSWTFSVARFKNGVDTGIASIVIKCNGYGSADMDYFIAQITAPWYVNLNPFAEDKLTSAVQPAYGDWKDGTLVYNTDSTKHYLGWFYNDGAWHTVGAY